MLATGRANTSGEGKEDRLFGFKAHFHGPQSDSVELYFFDGCYVGINPVEGGLTNVCGLGPAGMLKQYRFDPVALAQRLPALAERLKPLTPAWDWIRTGPLCFGQPRWPDLPPGVFPSGDALSFVDPFTGSGMLAAIGSGTLAGTAAARQWTSALYREKAMAALSRAYRVSSLLRASALREGPWTAILKWMEISWLYRLTRPQFQVEK